MSSVKINKSKNSKSDSALLSHIMNIFTFLILCLFPLFVMDKYYNILQAKYYFYIGSVILLVIAVIFAGCIEHNKLEKYITSFKWNDFIKKFSVTDVALLVFLIIAGISTISSDYVYESFWGNEGRFLGALLTLFVWCGIFLCYQIRKIKKMLFRCLFNCKYAGLHIWDYRLL